jgi:pimeloyl-ACP methyl ester carboxylesterase
MSEQPDKVDLADAVPTGPQPTVRFHSVDEALEGIRQVHRDVGRIVAADGVDVGRHVVLGGVQQWITMRGQSRSLPVLLFLHGGPGDPISELAYTYQRPWEDFFVVVNWDQRGFGRSWGSQDEAESITSSLTREQYVDDAIDLIDFLCAEFGQNKIIVVGQSWGTVLALELASRRPDLLHAVVTQGLAANWLASAALLLQHYQAEAERKGDTAEAERLRAVGPLPPSHDHEALFAWVRKFGLPFPDANTWHNIRGEGDGWGRRVETLKLISPDSTPKSTADHWEHLRQDFSVGMRRMRTAMLAALAWDAEADVGTEFDVPLIVMMGRHDWQTSTTLARAYYEKVSAPYKKWVEFPNAAHALNIEQPGLSVLSLVRDVLPAVQGLIPEGAEVRQAVSR